MKITIHNGRKKINLEAKNCSLLGKSIGLMFSRREKAKILLFEFSRKQRIAIHSFFVFYPFLAVWLDEKNDVMEIKTVKPFLPCILPEKPSCKLIEIPINKSHRKILKFFSVGN